MPDWLRDEIFPHASELIAAAHDVGKACPTFQKKSIPSPSKLKRFCQI
jgi:CRISPR/Cas system-associated endonuclease Cas3-HD